MKRFFRYCLLSLIGLHLSAPPSLALDISRVPFWDGETQDPASLLLNRFGGGASGGTAVTVTHVTASAGAGAVRSGKGAFRIDTNGTIAAGTDGFFTIALTGFGPSAAYIDSRDITRFDALEFWLRNDTGSPFALIVEIKDYRDTGDHKAERSYDIPATADWRAVSVPLAPLDGGNGWTVTGSPDPGRTRLIAVKIEASAGTAVSGSIYLDDMILLEQGGELDARTGNIDAIVDRIARRQFHGLWGSRDRDNGLVPGISAFADLLALNGAAALIKMLPVAVNLGWVTRSAADDYVALVVDTLGNVMDGVAATDNGGFLPPRYVDRVTLTPMVPIMPTMPDPGPEESSVDAAFMFLALYQYQALPTTPAALRTAIDGLLQRFNFAAFSDSVGDPVGWKLAYLYDTQTFTEGTYDGYSGEVWLISLAAHLQRNPSFRVDIATHYHSGVKRVQDYLIDPGRAHLVHEFDEFRAPFLQWLFGLFVDVTDRTRDTYPDPALASNPHDNALRYQLEVHASHTKYGRALFLQPDAGDDGTGNRVYEQFSRYQDFGQPDLFMPWSVAFSWLAEPPVAEAALRNHLLNGLHGPLGLSDAVHWTTGESMPDLVTARHDFWNLALSTMAFMQYRSGGNELLSSLPEVREALDRVMPPERIFSDGFE